MYSIYLLREISNYVILGGQSTRKKNSGALFAALLSISRQNSSKAQGTMKKLTFGLLEFWLMRCIMESHHSISKNMKIFLKL